MTAPLAKPFKPADDIPFGTLAIEASAGTGKTFTLAALAARFIADFDVPVSELLVVTFTRAATSELRNRVRKQLVDAAGYLRAASPPPAKDPLLDYLRATDKRRRAQRLARLDRAVTEFDAATITTIHGFAAQVLGTLGADAGLDPDAVLVDDSKERLAEVCADILAAAAVGPYGAADLPNLKTLREVTEICLGMPDLHLEPGPHSEGDERSTNLVLLAEQCVTAIADRRRRAGTISFDDVLVHLRTALDGPEGSSALAALRARFQVALIDEFQDTDPVQWAIFSALFGEPDAPAQMVLVGDPKQAIYAFRGANIHTFTSAVEPRPGLVNLSLGTNWRSDGAMLTALNTLFDGVTFGDPRIAYSPVAPVVANDAKRLFDERGGEFPSLSIRLALGEDIKRATGDSLPADDVRRAIHDDLAERLVDILRHGRLPDGNSDNALVPVRPSDIAVLVTSANEGLDIQAILRQRGIPAVLARGTSVLLSDAATQWRWLLNSLLRPSDPRRARAFALSCFGGLNAEEVEALDDETLGPIQDQLRAWEQTLRIRGVSEWIGQVWAESGVVARVLGTPDGDRLVTDLDHIGEILRGAAATGRLSVAGLLATLEVEPTSVAGDGGAGDATARRVESDEQAVQIMTVWVAKGLEFPIVCCPSLWAPRTSKVIYQDPATDRRTYDVANSTNWPDRASAAERKRLAEQEQLGEQLRLLYVALTRAKHHALIWWSRGKSSSRTGLGRVLFDRTDGAIDPGTFARGKLTLPKDEEVLQRLRPIICRSGGTIAAAVHGYRTSFPQWDDPAALRSPRALEIARLSRNPDRSRNRWSFTAMTRQFETEQFDPLDDTMADGGADDEQQPGESPDDQGDFDDWASPSGDVAERVAHAAPVTVSPLAALPAGAEFGTLVHSILEQVDFAADNLDGQLATAVDRALAWQPFDLTPTYGAERSPAEGRGLLIAGLRATVDTPLGPLFAGRRLRDVSPEDRLNELSFELLLGESGPSASVADIGRLVGDHLGPQDPLRAWADDLATGAPAADLAGHLTGSIDAVLRVEADDPRFVVIDYKTNRLGRRGEVPLPDDYSSQAMVPAMAEHHYPLQSLLYSVALHRYLRWRQAGYDPVRHLGGIAYLFVRGMSGSGVTLRDGHPDGVFTWAIPPALVVELSDLLDGHRVQRQL